MKSNVKEEVPGKASFLNKIGLLRAALLQLNRLSSSGGALQAKFAVAARADTALTAKHKDLEKATGALNKFKDGVQLKIAELESLPLVLEQKEEIKKELVAMDKLLGRQIIMRVGARRCRSASSPCWASAVFLFSGSSYQHLLFEQQLHSGENVCGASCFQ